jgi:hypothetical protein
MRDERETDDEADMEHRWGQRRETSRSVYLRTQTGLAAHGLLRNVSVSGAFILTPLPVSLFTRLQLFVAAEGRERRLLQPIEAEVVRRTTDGIAIEWMEFGNAIFRALGEMPGETRTAAEARSDADSSASTARKAR